MKIRIAGMLENSLTNGKGIRKVIFGQGCKHNCEECFNTHTHDFNGGIEMDTSEIINKINNDIYIDGVTFSGGDPFEQPKAFTEIANNISCNVWCYTGYTFEYIIDNLDKKPEWRELLNSIDVLVDGKFIKDLKNHDFKYRGSLNQRIIDVNESLENDEIFYYILDTDNDYNYLKRECLRESLYSYYKQLKILYNNILSSNDNDCISRCKELLDKISNMIINKNVIIYIPLSNIQMYCKEVISSIVYINSINIHVKPNKKIYMTLLNNYDRDLEYLISILYGRL